MAAKSRTAFDLHADATTWMASPCFLHPHQRSWSRYAMRTVSSVAVWNDLNRASVQILRALSQPGRITNCETAAIWQATSGSVA